MRRETKKGLMAVVVVLAGVGAAAQVARTEDVAGALPESMRDLTGAREVEIRDDAGQVVLRGTFAGPIAADGETKAALTGAAGTGEAEIEIESKSGARRTELEVDVEGLAANKAFAIHVDGQRAGALTTDAKGAGEIELATSTQ
jgi:hypothetical protein